MRSSRPWALCSTSIPIRPPRAHASRASPGAIAARQGAAAPGAMVEREALAQAAVAVILSGRVRSLYPLVLRRAGDAEAAWIEAQWHRHAQLGRPEIAALLSHRDPLVRRGILTAAVFEPEDLANIL